MPSKSHKKKVPPVQPVVEKAAKPAEPILPDSGGMLPGDAWWREAEKILSLFYDAGYLKEEKLPPKLAMIFLLKAREVDIKPMVALKSFSVLENGEIGFQSAELMRALIQRAGGSIIPVEMTNEKCVVHAIRGALKQPFQFTAQDAAALGLLQVWDKKKMSRSDMLFARASSRAARAMFADIISGLSYTEEEMATAYQIQAGAGEPVGSSPTVTTTSDSPAPPVAGPPEPRTEQPKPQSHEFAKGTNEKTGEERSLTRSITVRTAQGPQPFWSAGISGDQIDAIRMFASQRKEHQQAVQAWMTEVGWTKLTHLTEAEASECIAFMQSPFGEQTPLAEASDEKRLVREVHQPTTVEAAIAEFERVVSAIELGDFSWQGKMVPALHVAAGLMHHEDINTLTPAEIITAADTLRHVARTRPEVIKHTMERAIQILSKEGPFT